MLDVDQSAVVYGGVGYPGLARVDLSTGTVGSFANGTSLHSPHVSIVDGVSFYAAARTRHDFEERFVGFGSALTW